MGEAIGSGGFEVVHRVGEAIGSGGYRVVQMGGCRGAELLPLTILLLGIGWRSYCRSVFCR